MNTLIGTWETKISGEHLFTLEIENNNSIKLTSGIDKLGSMDLTALIGNLLKYVDSNAKTLQGKITKEDSKAGRLTIEWAKAPKKTYSYSLETTKLTLNNIEYTKK